MSDYQFEYNDEAFVAVFAFQKNGSDVYDIVRASNDEVVDSVTVDPFIGVADAVTDWKTHFACYSVF